MSFPPRLLRIGKFLGRYVGPIVSAAILLAALSELRKLDLASAFGRSLSPLFWIVFVALYLVPAVGDLVIYRRLWGRACPGLGDMLRKLVGNELLLGYAGDTYLFAAARSGGRSTIDVLRDVRDVTVLSAVVGSGVTLAAAALAWPWLKDLPLGLSSGAVLAAVAVIVAPPVAAFALGSRLFSLSLAERWRVSAVHAIRAMLTVLLTALLWALALPAVAASWWLVLSAVRLVIARLPFVTNRDVVFAAATTALLGRAAPVSGLFAMVAALTIAAHVAVGLGLALAGAWRSRTKVPEAA